MEHVTYEIIQSLCHKYHQSCFYRQIHIFYFSVMNMTQLVTYVLAHGRNALDL